MCGCFQVHSRARPFLVGKQGDVAPDRQVVQPQFTLSVNPGSLTCISRQEAAAVQLRSADMDQNRVKLGPNSSNATKARIGMPRLVRSLSIELGFVD